jgi:hypothetical protein
MQKIDAIVLFDNGSSRYGIGDLQAKLAGVAGIEKLVIESWPYRYGMTDAAFVVNPFYILFLQVSSMSVVLRRYGARAYGILNCDVDELAVAPKGQSVLDIAKQSRHGLLVMKGRYVEAVAEAGAPAVKTHRHFQHHLADLKKADGGPTKWALDPTRKWVENLAVHPYMHWIQGRPLFGKLMLDDAYYRHFRGINTNWKDNRTEPNGLRAEDLRHDAEFADLVTRNAF